VVTSIAKRVKTYVFRDKGVVLLFCPRINVCSFFCSTYRKYARLGYDIVCLNTDYYRTENVEKILEEELKKRSELKNRLGFSASPPSS